MQVTHDAFIRISLLSLILVTGCSTQTSVEHPMEQDLFHENEKKEMGHAPFPPQPTVSPSTNNENTGPSPLPSPLTFEDQRQVENVITTYFKALEQKDYDTAYELWAPSAISWLTKEEFAKRSEQVDSIKIISMEGYYITPSGPTELPPNTPTVWFAVSLDVKTIGTTPGGWITGSYTYFPGVFKDNDGQWRIYGLGTSR